MGWAWADPSDCQRGGLLRLGATIALLWLVLVSAAATVSALAIAGTRGIWDLIPGNTVTLAEEWAGVRFNLIALGLATGISVAVGIVRPRWWRRVMVAIILLPALTLLFTSQRVSAACAALALFGPLFWLGRETAAALFGDLDRVEAWVIGSALGSGFAAFLGFALGGGGLLSPQALVPALGGIVLMLAGTAHWRLRADLAALGQWLGRPVAGGPLGLAFAGIAVAYLWLNFIGALAPETATDATWQRLAAAAQFAERGSLTTDDPALTVANDPAMGEAIYAVGLVLGPLATAKLQHFLIGLCCTAAVFAVGRRLGGDEVGQLAALIFYTMPLVAWLSQIGFLDLFLGLFAMTAVLVTVLDERPDWRAAIVAGACMGCGVAVKLHFGYIAVALAVVLTVMALRRGGYIAAARLVVTMTVAALLVALPWLLRSYFLLGQIPGFVLATQSLARAEGPSPAVIGDLGGFGFGRSLSDLARAPLDLTLRSYRFEINPTPSGPFGGMIGYLFLGLTPLLALARPRRPTAAITAGILVAFVLWFYTAQYLRYALPIFAMLCPASALAYRAARRRLGDTFGGVALNAALIVLVLAGVSVQMRVPALGRQFALGREDEATYLKKYIVCCSGYTVVQLLNAEPGAVRAIATSGIARVYARVPIISLPLDGSVVDATGDEEVLLAQLRTGDFTHIIVGRQGGSADWDRMTLTNEDFLRRNSVLVGGDARAYLYRLVPPEQGSAPRWAEGRELIANGDFEMADGAVPLGWIPTGQPVYVPSGDPEHHGRAVVLGSTDDAFTRTIPLAGNGPYLLSHTTRAASTGGAALDDRLEIRIGWRGADDATIGTAVEVARASTRGYRTQSIPVHAPPGALTATIQVRAKRGKVWFDDVSLRSIHAQVAGARTPWTWMPEHQGPLQARILVGPASSGTSRLVPGTIVRLLGPSHQRTVMVRRVNFLAATPVG